MKGDGLSKKKTFILVRIVEGQSFREGRVEVYFSGAWGVVCGAGWDMIDAAVVCRLLGYGGASTYQSNITFKPENGTMWLTEVRCIGNETSLWQCEHAGWGENTCVGSQAAGVTCFEQGNNNTYLQRFSFECRRLFSFSLVLNSFAKCNWLKKHSHHFLTEK